jgi:hypothetical protein
VIIYGLFNDTLTKYDYKVSNGGVMINNECTERTGDMNTFKSKVKVKVKFSLEQATKAQRGNRGIALLFL